MVIPPGMRKMGLLSWWWALMFLQDRDMKHWVNAKFDSQGETIGKRPIKSLGQFGVRWSEGGLLVRPEFNVKPITDVKVDFTMVAISSNFHSILGLEESTL